MGQLASLDPAVPDIGKLARELQVRCAVCRGCRWRQVAAGTPGPVWGGTPAASYTLAAGRLLTALLLPALPLPLLRSRGATARRRSGRVPRPEQHRICTVPAHCMLYCRSTCKHQSTRVAARGPGNWEMLSTVALGAMRSWLAAVAAAAAPGGRLWRQSTVSQRRHTPCCATSDHQPAHHTFWCANPTSSPPERRQLRRRAPRSNREDASERGRSAAGHGAGPRRRRRRRPARRAAAAAQGLRRRGV